MLNKFKSALYTAAGGLGLSPLAEIANAAPGDNIGATGCQRPAKFAYQRPEFLQLNSDDEISVSGDRSIRPIIVPRDSSKLPWSTGYAEAVNAGKSKRNEDNGCVHVGYLSRPSCRGLNGHATNGRTACGDAPCHPADNSPDDAGASAEHGQCVPYYYFALFDGHAGHGASLAAAQQLHHIVHARLMDAVEHLLPPCEHEQSAPATARGACSAAMFWIASEQISVEQVIVGALEAAFHDMDETIGGARLQYDMRGGCTALVALFILGKLFVANAGDSRAVLCRSGHVFLATHDFTPETERHRIKRLASEKPSLLGDEFTAREFCRRVTTRDVGSRLLCREPHMTGWAYRTVQPHDLRFPLVCGEGKRSRVCATIGVTRGFGDHDLRAQGTNVFIKPFLSSQPQVLVVDLCSSDSLNHTDNNHTDDNGSPSADNCQHKQFSEDDCLVLATDGLWDVVSSERVAALLHRSLQQFPSSSSPSSSASSRHLDAGHTARYRYTSAAQELVMAARGKLVEGLWRTADGGAATIDDISVLVVPLLPYQQYAASYQTHRQHLDVDVAMGADCAVKQPPRSPTPSSSHPHLPTSPSPA